MAPGNCFVTLKLWHGGSFSKTDSGLMYTGKCTRTVSVDVDELCWFTIVEEAEKSTKFQKEVDGIFYLAPVDGLKRVVDDTDTNVIRGEAIKCRLVDCFIVVEKHVDEVLRLIELSKNSIYSSQPKKLTPKRKKGPPELTP